MWPSSFRRLFSGEGVPRCAHTDAPLAGVKSAAAEERPSTAHERTNEDPRRRHHGEPFAQLRQYPSGLRLLFDAE